LRLAGARMTIAIRAAASADASRLALIGQATFLQSYAHMLHADDILAHCTNQHSAAFYAEQLANPAARFWLAEIEFGAAPIGYLMLDKPHLPNETGPDDIEIRRIYVLHRFHGEHVGARLVSAALDAARDMGRRRALLAVYHGNTPAIAFYRRM